MPDYQKTKIYQIWSPNSEKVYVGATVQTLAQRMGKHRKPSNNTRSKIIIDLGDARIELLKEFPCNSKMESDKKEGEYIRNLDCVNKQIAGRTLNEYRIDNKDKLNDDAKVYYINNKVKVDEYKKQYNKNNKELVAKRKQANYEKNKSQILEEAKLYREKNKDKIAIDMKAYTEKNKLKIAEYRKVYYEANIEKIREKDRARGVIRRAKAKLEKEQSLI
tara:strand:- start:211 stop:867 length:657 start_codon:yes stop_codon:yes gene_type:complete